MFIIYTVITNNYIQLNTDQDYIPGVRYVCFTDNSYQYPIPPPWEHILIKSDIKNPIILSRLPNIKSHEYFDKNDTVFYFDGKECLRVDVVLKYLNSLDDNYDFGVKLHPSRITYCDEMIWLYSNGLIYEDEIKLKTKQLIDEKYKFIEHQCVLTNGHIRKITDYTIEFEKLWWEEYLKFKCYANRDQIPFVITLSKINERHLFFDRHVSFDNGFIERNKTTSHPDFRPNLNQIANMQTWLTSTTKVPLISELKSLKPLQV